MLGRDGRSVRCLAVCSSAEGNQLDDPQFSDFLSGEGTSFVPPVKPPFSRVGASAKEDPEEPWEVCRCRGSSFCDCFR